MPESESEHLGSGTKPDGDGLDDSANISGARMSITEQDGPGFATNLQGSSKCNISEGKERKKFSMRLPSLKSQGHRQGTIRSLKASVIDEGADDEILHDKLSQAAEDRRQGKAAPLVIALPTTEELPTNSTHKLNVSDKTGKNNQQVGDQAEEAATEALLQDAGVNNSGPGSAKVEQIAPSPSIGAQNERSEKKAPLLLRSKLRRDKYLKNDEEMEMEENENRGEISKDDLHQELSHLPTELNPESDAYRAVPINEFGAALLRGMGWKGPDEENGSRTNSKDKNERNNPPPPRHHRLGLGAMPAPPDSVSNRKRGSQMIINSRKRHFATQNEGSGRQREVKQELVSKEDEKRQEVHRMQNELCTGSIVYINEDRTSGHNRRGCRAMVVQSSGVPGLNRIKVLFENTQDVIVINKSDVEKFASVEELDVSPFKDSRGSSRERIRNVNETEGNDRDGRGSKRSREDINVDDKNRRREKTTDDKYSAKKSKYEKSDDLKGSSTQGQSERRSRSDMSDRGSRSTVDSRQDRHWLIPNIRVRIVSHKVEGDKYFKEKAVVIDTIRPGVGVLKLSKKFRGRSKGESILLEGVKEKYLETALPKEGGWVIILAGKQKYQRGRLISRNSRRSEGTVQLLDEQDIVVVPFDDMAEWCGKNFSDTE